MFRSTLMGFYSTSSHPFLPISFISILTKLMLLIFIFQLVINSFQKLIISLIFNSNSTKCNNYFSESLFRAIFSPEKSLTFVIVIQFAFANKIKQHACNYLINTAYTATGPGNIMELNPVFRITNIVCQSSCFPLNMFMGSLVFFFHVQHVDLLHCHASELDNNTIL